MKTNARSGRLGKAVKVLVVTMLAGLIILLLFLRGISIPSAKLPPEGRTESVISRARHILEGFSISVRLGYLKERKIFRDLLTVSEGDDYIKINRQVYGIWKEWLSQTVKDEDVLAIVQGYNGSVFKKDLIQELKEEGASKSVIYRMLDKLVKSHKLRYNSSIDTYSIYKIEQ